MLIPNKYNGYSRDGRRLYYFDMGNDQPTTPEKTTQVTELPEWAKGYAKDTLAKGAALTDINKNPYQQYGGERIAGFQPLQQQAFKTIGGLDAGPEGFQKNISSYMSPYMQNVVDIQKREAGRQSGILGQQIAAKAVQSGAFGGSRQALQTAERDRNLAEQMNDIQTRGSQAAYDSASNQFRQGITQQSGLAQMQGQMGALQQQQAQRPLDMAYQDFLNQQNYPYKQLGYMSDLVRGMPLGQQSTAQMYQAPGNLMGQLGGLGMGAYGLYKMGFGESPGKAEGGLTYADGGVTDPQNVENILAKLSDQQLQQAKEAALNRRDLNEAQMIDAEIAQRATMRGANPQMPEGIAPAISDQFANDMEQSMATGGIVAFADKGAVKEMPEKATSPIGDLLESIGVTGGLNALRESYYKSREGEKRIEGAENMYPGPAEALRPSERARRTAAGNTLFKGPQDVKAMTPEEIEAANAEITKSTPPATSTAGAGRGSYKDYTPAEDIKGAPSAPKQAKGLGEVMSGPKPSKAAVKSAVEQLAEKQGLSTDIKDDVMANALKITDEFGKRNQPILDRLNAAIEAQKPNEQAIKDRGLAQALTQFGFGMAQQAAKPGARFLESASAASPVIGSVLEKTNTLIDTQKQNYAKLQLDQARYEVSLAKGDMQTAATLAGQIRQGQQQDKLLQYHIAKAQDDLQMEKAKLASQNTYQQSLLGRHETIGSLTRDIMQNEGLPYNKALEKAGRLVRPAGYAADVRAGTTENANLDKALEKIDKKYMLLPMMDPKDPTYARMKAEYDAAVRAAYANHNKMVGGQAGSTAPTISPDAFKIEKLGK
jgi:hypothetical protein